MSCPNVLLVILDAVRSDHVGCYGYGRPTTPTLDALAAESVLFEDVISPAIWTLPSHASIFTGTYPSRHRTGFGSFLLPSALVTLAEFLREQGYATAGFTSNYYSGPKMGLDRGFDVFSNPNSPPFKRASGWQGIPYHLYRRMQREMEKYLLCDRGGSRANKLVARWLADLDANQPFFLFVNYLEAHLPYRPPNDRLAAIVQNDEDLISYRQVNQDAWSYMVGQVSMNEGDFAKLMTLYDAAIRYVDGLLAGLLKILGKQGKLDDTLIFVTSDHGEHLGEHQLMDHQYSVYEPLLRVPLVVRFPTALRKAARVGHLVQTLDIFPTVLDVLGISKSAMPQLQGCSLLDRELPDRVALAEYLAPNLEVLERRFPYLDHAPFNRALRSVRCGHHKYIWSSDGRDELFDLERDPGELHNLIEHQPELAAELRREMESLVGNLEHSESEADSVLAEDDPEVIRRLQDLGYL